MLTGCQWRFVTVGLCKDLTVQHLNGNSAAFIIRNYTKNNRYWDPDSPPTLHTCESFFKWTDFSFEKCVILLKECENVYMG